MFFASGGSFKDCFPPYEGENTVLSVVACECNHINTLCIRGAYVDSSLEGQVIQNRSDKPISPG